MPRKTKNPAKRSGVEIIVDYLTKHKAEIGAIVVGLVPHAGQHLVATDHSGVEEAERNADGLCFAADRILPANEEERGNCGLRTRLTRGAAEVLLDSLRTRGF